MAVCGLNSFEQKCKGFNFHLCGIVVSVVFWAHFDFIHGRVEICRNRGRIEMVSAWGDQAGGLLKIDSDKSMSAGKADNRPKPWEK